MLSLVAFVLIGCEPPPPPVPGQVDRTGEVLADDITMPHTREVDGLPASEDAR